MNGIVKLLEEVPELQLVNVFVPAVHPRTDKMLVRSAAQLPLSGVAVKEMPRVLAATVLLGDVQAVPGAVIVQARPMMDELTAFAPAMLLLLLAERV